MVAAPEDGCDGVSFGRWWEAGRAGRRGDGGAALTLAREAQAARQFTDTGSFTLRCLVCQAGLVGQEDAVKHATETGHQNFSEY